MVKTVDAIAAVQEKPQPLLFAESPIGAIRMMANLAFQGGPLHPTEGTSDDWVFSVDQVRGQLKLAMSLFSSPEKLVEETFAEGVSLSLADSVKRERYVKCLDTLPASWAVAHTLEIGECQVKTLVLMDSNRKFYLLHLDLDVYVVPASTDSGAQMEFPEKKLFRVWRATLAPATSTLGVLELHRQDRGGADIRETALDLLSAFSKLQLQAAQKHNQKAEEAWEVRQNIQFFLSSVGRRS